jgi:uncharacterized membrane protein
MKSTRSLLLTSAVSLLAACAATPPAEQKTAGAPEAGKECVKTTGSNICRAPGTGNMNQVDTISGEDLRRSGGPITGARPGTIGN